MSFAFTPPTFKMEVEKDDLEIDQLQDDEEEEITDEEEEEPEAQSRIHAKSVLPAVIRVQTTEELNGKTLEGYCESVCTNYLPSQLPFMKVKLTCLHLTNEVLFSKFLIQMGN